MTALNTRVQLKIWDTAGQERLRSVTRSFYRGCHAVVLVYDVTNQQTFTNLNWWFDELKNYAEPLLIYLVGNKLDMESERKVERNVGEKFASENQVDYFLETSAHSGKFVENLFYDIAEKLMEKVESGELTCEKTPDVIQPGMNFGEPIARNNQLDVKPAAGKWLCC